MEMAELNPTMMMKPLCLHCHVQIMIVFGTRHAWLMHLILGFGIIGLILNVMNKSSFLLHCTWRSLIVSKLNSETDVWEIIFFFCSSTQILHFPLRSQWHSFLCHHICHCSLCSYHLHAQPVRSQAWQQDGPDAEADLEKISEEGSKPIQISNNL